MRHLRDWREGRHVDDRARGQRIDRRAGPPAPNTTMSKESFTGIENYLHDLQYAKSKKSVLHSITSKSKATQPSLLSLLPVRVSSRSSRVFHRGVEMANRR